MITWLINRSPTVRRLRSAHEAELAKNRRLAQELEETEAALERAYATAVHRGPPRVARFRLADAMPEDEIAQKLAGTQHTPPIKAIVAHLSAKIVAAADLATDEPRELIVTPERVLAPYTGEMRLHDAGKASAYAEVLADLQELTADKKEEKPEEGG